MTASSLPAVTAAAPTSDRVSTIAAVVAATTFALVGLTLVGVGMGFPLALSVVDQRNIPIAPADLALAERMAPLWPGFVGAGALSFVAALAVLDRGRLGKSIAVVVSGTGAALAAAAGVLLVIRGASPDAVDVANGAGLVFLLALVATVAVRERAAVR